MFNIQVSLVSVFIELDKDKCSNNTQNQILKIQVAESKFYEERFVNSIQCQKRLWDPDGSNVDYHINYIIVKCTDARSTPTSQLVPRATPKNFSLEDERRRRRRKKSLPFYFTFDLRWDRVTDNCHVGMPTFIWRDAWSSGGDKTAQVRSLSQLMLTLSLPLQINSSS